MRWFVWVLLAVLASASQAHAASYTLPLDIGSAPFGCTLTSGTTYDCPASITLGNGDSVVASSASLTLIVTGDLTIPSNVTWGNSSFNINVVATGTVTLGDSNNTDFFGNITAATVNMGNNATVSGTCTTNGSFSNSGNCAGGAFVNGCTSSTSGTVTTITCTSNGTFTPPSGITLALVEAWGGGGGGGNSTSTTLKGGGGAGGQYVYKLTAVSAGTSYNVVVGQGGGSATAGSDSTFSTTTVVAKGGAAGSSNGASHGAGGAGSTTGGVGDFVFMGGNGASGSGSGGGGGGGGAGNTGNGGNASGRTGGTGNATGGGNGGTGPNTDANGVAGSTYGGGGSGANKTTGGNKTGGAGANGVVIITYATSTPSPIADWRMDETTAFTGAAGEVKNSVSGGTDATARRSANNLPVTAAFPGNVSGKLCGGVDVNGVNYLLVTGLSSQLSGTASLSFWVKTTQVGNNTPWSAPGVTGVEKGGTDGSNDIFWGYINATGKMALHKGSSAGAQSTSIINNGTWRHIVLTRNASSPGETKIYVDGVLEATRNMDFSLVTTAFSSLGRMESTYGSGLSGALDELKVYAPVLSATQVASIYANESAGKNWDGSARVCPVGGPHHLEIQHSSGTGLTCAASTLTVRACADAACTTPYTGGVSGTLTATGTPTVNWDGTTGGATGNGFVIAFGSSSVTKSVQVPTVGSVVFGATANTPTATNATTCNFGSPSCTFTANTAGFIFTNSPTSTSSYSIPAQVSGSSSPPTIYLRALDGSNNPAVCTPAIISQTVGVSMYYGCSNPSSCQSGNLATINSTAIDSNSVLPTSVNLSFDANASAPMTVRYDDVGQITLNARKIALPFTGATNITLTGNSNAFVVAPHHFGISGVTAGPIKAESNFAGSVTAYNGLATPTVTKNFGLENTLPTLPEGVSLSFTKCLPSGAGTSNGSFSGSVGSFSSGIASASNLNWSEVGNGDLVATLTSGSYLGSTLSASGTTASTPGALYNNTCNASGSAGNVGRFIPDHFETAILSALTPTTPIACPSGMTCPANAGGTNAPLASASLKVSNGMVYANQPFTVQVTAKNAAATPATTVNYQGSFAKATTLSAWNAKGADPAIAANANPGGGAVAGTAPVFVGGVARVVDSAYGTTLPALLAPTDVYFRAAEATGGDGVTSRLSTPADSVEAGLKIASGRIKIPNVYGSEKLLLPMVFTVQYYNGSNAWLTSTTDSTTTFNSVLSTAPTPGNLTATKVSGVDNCISVNTPANAAVAAGVRTVSLSATAACSYNISLASALPTFPLPTYLPIYPAAGGRATFGIYKSPLIYRRENY